MSDDQAILELDNISKHFGGVQALEDVSISLYPGEIHALMGENGAGKSTLIKVMGGVHRPDVGATKVRGEVVELHDPAQARDMGIAVIHQEPTLFPDLDVAENIFMGRHPTDRLGRVDWSATYERVDELLDELGVRLNLRAPVQGLPVADQQSVEIAKAISLDAQVLIMDEPTAALSPKEVEELFTLVRGFKEQGVAILFVSHRLEEVFELADRVTVLRDGMHVTTAPSEELTPDDLIRHMVGRSVDSSSQKEESQIGDVALEVRNLGRVGAFHDVSFELCRGEILGFAGLIGAGRSEVARVLFGIDQADEGDIKLEGQQVSIDSPAKALEYGLAYVPEDRREQGLIMEFSLAKNQTLPIVRRISSLGLIDRSREQNIAEDFSERLQVRSAGVNQVAEALSGGNQQKIVLAKWLATQPSVLILDEPTRGVDVGAKAEIHRIISGLAAEGKAIMLISSELPEVLNMSDRILVMHEGRLTGEFAREEADQEKLMYAATGQVGNGSQ